jgi:hypothetical protein
MFLLDSLMISGLQWTLKTVAAAAEAEMNDDSALRDRLMEAEMQREMGEITDAQFASIEADLLQAIREIKERRDGGTGALAFGAGQPIEAGQDATFQVEAEIAGDFYGQADGTERSAEATPPRTIRTTRTTRTIRTPRTPRTIRTIRTPPSK